jgi:hypothetical protein
MGVTRLRLTALAGRRRRGWRAIAWCGLYRRRCPINRYLRSLYLPRNAQVFAAAAVKSIFHQQIREAAREAVGKAVGAAGAEVHSCTQVVREAAVSPRRTGVIGVGGSALERH